MLKANQFVKQWLFACDRGAANGTPEMSERVLLTLTDLRTQKRRIFPSALKYHPGGEGELKGKAMPLEHIWNA